MMHLFVSKVRAAASAVVLTFAALSVASSSAHAQAPIRVNIPFSFQNGTQQLPAGKYTVQVNPSSHILLIRGESKSGMSMTLPDQSSQASTVGKVVFRCYGDRYFLREVWYAGSTEHVHTPKSRAEKQVEVAATQKNAAGNEVALLEMPR